MNALLADYNERDTGKGCGVKTWFVNNLEEVDGSCLSYEHKISSNKKFLGLEKDVTEVVAKSDYDEVCKERDMLKDDLTDHYNSISQARHDMYSEQVVPLALELDKVRKELQVYRDWALEVRVFIDEVTMSDVSIKLGLVAEELLTQFPSPTRQESDE